MLPDQLETEAMKCADPGSFEQRELFLAMNVARILLLFFLEPRADALAHFGGGGFGEGHH